MPDGSFQTLTLEYRVFGECDGVTIAPSFSEGEVDDRQIVVFEVENLGIIPLRFDEEPNPEDPVSPADRFLTWAILYGEQTAVGFDSGLSVVFFEQSIGYQPIEPGGQIPPGQEGIYIQRCIKVPGGAALRVADIIPQGGRPAVIRLRVQRPENSEQAAMLENACCCKAAQPIINLPDEPNGACPEDLAIERVDPDTVGTGVAPVTITVTGSGFEGLGSPGMSFQRPDGGGGIIELPLENLNVIDDNTIEVDVTPLIQGVYDVFVGDTVSQNCFTSLLQAFTVVAPG